VRGVVPARLRRVIFWFHLCTGAVAGVFILIMSVTGALLAYQQEITDWGNRFYRSAPPSPAAEKLPMETLLSKVRETEPSLPPSQVTVSSDVYAPASVLLGQRQSASRSVFVNRYTGALVATEGSNATDRVMRQILDLHRYLGASDRGTRAGAVGRAITGISTIGFSFLVCSGFFLWWPRSWNLGAIKNAMVFRRRLRGQVRDFNRHQAIRFWALVPLLIISLSGVTMSYSWATNLVFHLTGSPIVALGPGAAAASAEASRGPNRKSAISSQTNSMSLDSLFVQAERQLPQWRFISLRVPRPSDDSVTFGIDPGESRSPNQKVTVMLDRTTGDVVSLQTAAGSNRGAQVRMWLRSAHTGQVYGVASQTIAALVCLGAAFEVWTGLSMLWRHSRGWLVRRRVERVFQQEVASGD
jgi:uncharacterized iron-regulated membrane protein